SVSLLDASGDGRRVEAKTGHPAASCGFFSVQPRSRWRRKIEFQDVISIKLSPSVTDDAPVPVPGPPQPGLFRDRRFSREATVFRVSYRRTRNRATREATVAQQGWVRRPAFPRLRSANLELVSRYFHPDPDEASDLETAMKQPCPACLGILQQYACDSFYQEVIQKVKEADFEFSDYQFSVMLPVSTILRQHAVFVHLLEKYESIYTGKEDGIPSIKDVWKWTAGPPFSELLGVPFQMRSSFDILVNISYKPSEQECTFLLDVFPNTFRRRKVKKGSFETFTRASVAKAAPSESCTCDITVSHDAVFVAGRYQKYSRVLSQTPWVVDGVTKMEGSVQELICQVLLQRFRPTDHKFSSSGREDVDVRMLGLGRPFVVEMINPHRVKFSQEDMAQIQQETNALTKDVAIRDLQIVTREDIGNLKEGEIDKSKTYTALCWCQRPLTHDDLVMIENTKDLVLHQKTPVRVLHRRAVATRDRVVYTMRAERTSGLQFRLDLTTQAGTYVKEFVHGDFGRTQPNLGTLLQADCDILQLDVTAVDVDWPPMADPVPEEERQRLKERESNKTVKQAGHKDDNGSDRVNPTRQSSKLVTRMTTGQTV
ncbi:hypothetical protein BaRGS_00020330, partial [Batillaria attramentaria]